MTRLLTVLALSLALVTAPATPAPATAQGAPAPARAEPAQAAGSGLPRRAPDPMTLREYWPVFLGFSVTWLGIVACFLSIGRSYGRTARAVAGLDGGSGEP